MKILKLRFKNLNSLYGEWCINFTAPEYVADGIFAITGPTGAGKSTVLDAICLALYGATPRLGKISKSSNEIMSRQTGECFAEVTFATRAGQFICHWQQHRAHKKVTGNLIETKHEIADAVNGAILESKKRGVAAVIEQKTGMNFERFTRSILLAQGGFDTFLKADSDHRAPILEQITGSEIYTEISKRVHERQRNEREKLNLLQAETAGITILSIEQETEIAAELEQKQRSESELATEYKKIERAGLWLDGIEKLRHEISLLTKENETFDQKNVAFKPKRDKLALALKAAEFEGEFATLSAIRQQQKLDQEHLQKAVETIPEKEKEATCQEENLKKSEVATDTAKKRQKSGAQTVQKVRLLDQQLFDRKSVIKTQENDHRNLSEQINEQQRLLHQARAKLKRCQKEIESTQEYLSTNKQDEVLITQLAGIKEQINSLQNNADDIIAKETLLHTAEKQLQLANKFFNSQTLKFNKCQQEYEAVQTRIAQKKTALKDLLNNRLLREYRTEKETLLKEMLFLHKITELETERDQLTDGKPCPLCGSPTHPFAEANIPEKNSTEEKIDILTKLINKAENLENSITKLETSAKENSIKVNASEKKVATNLNDRKNCEKERDRISTDINLLKQHFTQLQETVLAGLKPFDVKKIPADNPSQILSTLKNRCEKWLKVQDKKGVLNKQSADLNSEIKKIEAIIATFNHSADGFKMALVDHHKEYDTQLSERHELFGNKDPEIEEAELGKAVTETEFIEKTARKKREQALQNLNTARAQITSLEKRLRERVSEIHSAATDFVAELQKTGFANEASFITCRLPAAERTQLKQQAQEIDNSMTELKSRKKDRELSLTKELAKKITESTLAELEPKQRERNEVLKVIRDEIGGHKQVLAENQQARIKIKNKQALIDAQKRECHKWEKLHSLIGSADGKKFRNFAQGLTFELMVAHANRQLEKMTDRYLLLRDDREPLELNVVDNYQAGEIRSTKNLSGGESFIVSLALALGLSKMASRRVRVDSLFLDEGFGTLDEDALETALETLAGLQHHSKLIGIISHVPALKERIGTQITILPGIGGKSTIDGPGCQRL